MRGPPRVRTPGAEAHRARRLPARAAPAASTRGRALPRPGSSSGRASSRERGPAGQEEQGWTPRLLRRPLPLRCLWGLRRVSGLGCFGRLCGLRCFGRLGGFLCFGRLWGLRRFGGFGGLCRFGCLGGLCRFSRLRGLRCFGRLWDLRRFGGLDVLRWRARGGLCGLGRRVFRSRRVWLARRRRGVADQSAPVRRRAANAGRHPCRPRTAESTSKSVRHAPRSTSRVSSSQRELSTLQVGEARRGLCREALQRRKEVRPRAPARGGGVTSPRGAARPARGAILRRGSPRGSLPLLEQRVHAAREARRQARGDLGQRFVSRVAAGVLRGRLRGLRFGAHLGGHALLGCRLVLCRRVCGGAFGGLCVCGVGLGGLRLSGWRLFRARSVRRVRGLFGRRGLRWGLFGRRGLSRLLGRGRLRVAYRRARGAGAAQGAPRPARLPPPRARRRGLRRARKRARRRRGGP